MSVSYSLRHSERNACETLPHVTLNHWADRPRPFSQLYDNVVNKSRLCHTLYQVCSGNLADAVSLSEKASRHKDGAAPYDPSFIGGCKFYRQTQDSKTCLLNYNTVRWLALASSNADMV